MNLKIEKGLAKGVVDAPASKSMAHRLLICASLAQGESLIKGISNCKDVLATLDCLSALGVQAKLCGDDVLVSGNDLKKACPSSILDCNESGSTLRFFIPIALLSGKTVKFTGSNTLMQRPMSVYEDLCKEKNLSFNANGKIIAVKGPLKGGEYTVVGNISSQFISGLLFALPMLDKDSKINIIPPIESRSYIEMTRDAQAQFGVNSYWLDEHTLFIPGKQKYKAQTVTVEGDYSGSAFIEALNLFGGDVKVNGLKKDSIQGDAVYQKYFEMLSKGVATIHIGDCPDLGPILFAVACAKHGGVFSGTKRLKIKESDRASAMAEELKKFGCAVTVLDDKVVVYPVEFHAPTEPIKCHNDHRIAMSCAILLTLTGGNIENVECVSKSYPAFFTHLKALGIKAVEYEA